MAVISPVQALLFGCPIAGEVAPVSQCSDPTFATGILGPGVVILPKGHQLFSPADAAVEFSLHQARPGPDHPRGRQVSHPCGHGHQQAGGEGL